MPLSQTEVPVYEEQNERDDDNKNKNKNKKKKKEAKRKRFLIPFVSKIKRKPISPSPSSSSSGFWKKVCFCGGVDSSNTMEWSCCSNSEAKDENLTSEMFRVLLQRNDFFSSDSNPHL